MDDGKSTLVGRLLYDTKSVLADQIEAVHRASVDKGLATPDLSLLVDGLRAEREQGITIDVAYRYFATPTREFVLADTPGHVQYTRNTVTGASTAELAVLLVDARNGVVEQTRRHAAVLALLRVPRLVLAINKIDLVDYDEAVLTAIAQGLRRAGPLARLRRRRRRHDPGVGAGRRQRRRALRAHPLVRRARRCSGTWSRCRSPGPEVAAPFRMPVQYVIRPRTDASYPTTAATPARSRRAPWRAGDEVVVLPGGARDHGRPRSTPPTARWTPPAPGAASPCCWPTTSTSPAATCWPRPTPPRRSRNELDATLCWLAEQAAAPRRPAAAQARHPDHAGDRRGAGRAAGHRDGDLRRRRPSSWRSTTSPGSSLRTADPLPVDDYADIRATGSFLLIDPPTGNTLAAGPGRARPLAVAP